MVTGAAGQAQVWVVDDTRDMRELYAAILTRAGYQVSCFESPDAALAALGEGRPAVAIVDYMMPGCTGADFIRRTRSALGDSAPPMLVLTASAVGEHVQDSLDAGARDFLKKPVSARILVARVEIEVQKAKAATETAKKQAQAVHLEKEIQEAVALESSSSTEVPVDLGGWRCKVAWNEGTGWVPPVTITERGPYGRIVVLAFASEAAGAAGAMWTAALRTRLHGLLPSRSLPVAVHVVREQILRNARVPRLRLVGLEGFGDHVLTVRTQATAIRLSMQAPSALGSLPSPPSADVDFEFGCVRCLPGEVCALWTEGFRGPVPLWPDSRQTAKELPRGASVGAAQLAVAVERNG